MKDERLALERRIGLDWFPINPTIKTLSMRPVEVPLATLYLLARAAQSYLGVHYIQLTLGFPPPQTAEKRPPNLRLVAHAIDSITEQLNAEVTLDRLGSEVR